MTLTPENFNNPCSTMYIHNTPIPTNTPTTKITLPEITLIEDNYTLNRLPRYMQVCYGTDHVVFEACAYYNDPTNSTFPTDHPTVYDNMKKSNIFDQEENKKVVLESNHVTTRSLTPGDDYYTFRIVDTKENSVEEIISFATTFFNSMSQVLQASSDSSSDQFMDPTRSSIIWTTTTPDQQQYYFLTYKRLNCDLVATVLVNEEQLKYILTVDRYLECLKDYIQNDFDLIQDIPMLHSRFDQLYRVINNITPIGA